VAVTQRAVSDTSPEQLDVEQRATVGVDVGGTTTTAVRFAPGEHAVAAVATAPTPQGAQAIVHVVGRLVADVADGAAEPIGVGMPGRVDVATGIVSSAVNLGITEPVEVAAMLADRVGRIVHVENDVNAAALGAFAHLKCPPSSSLAYVNVGTGIAAGYVLHGQLWRGATGGAGEIGHVPMRDGGPACHCGQDGCAEAIGSGRAARGGPRAREDVLAATAWAVQLCAMALDVDVVVVGGGMTRPPDAFLIELQEVLTARAEASPMLAALGLADRVAVASADVPLGNLGAALAADRRQAVS
jgi:glucokinase